MSTDDFEKMYSPRPRGIHKENLHRILAIEKQAIGIIERISPFTFATFERELKGGKTKAFSTDVFAALEGYANQLNEENRLRTAETYLNCRKSLNTYHKRKQLEFAEVDVAFLEGYEAWMLDQGKSVTTIGIYLRSLRAILNQGIQNGILHQSQYPFGKGRYQIPASRNVKKALTISDIKLIAGYQPKSEIESKYRDYWLFIYLCNGMNIKDMALLRFENIDGDKLNFIRAKTRRTTKQDQKTISVPLLSPTLAIIKRWGNRKRNLQTFLFPILNKKQSEAQQLAAIKQETKQINKYMRRIGAKLGIEKDITTYTARHTFSTVLKRSGAPVEYISESLGHTNLATTERYLDSFEDEVKRSFADKLLDF